jgi:hypothetical protein
MTRLRASLARLVVALTVLAAGRATAGVPGVPLPKVLPRPWVGSVVRYVALNPEQQQAGLDGADVFYGMEAGIEHGRFAIAGEVTTGDATQRLGIDGTDDPRLRIWTAAAQVRAGLLPALPIYGYAGGGLWRFDYRDESVTLEYPGVPPIDVTFEDFAAPALSAGLGVALQPQPWLGVGADIGVMGLRLNEARIDGSTLEVESHWRASPTAAVRVRFML